ncbi:unnamed protein product [Enterobius vermicularis]|uniref:mRNA_decap_C domain-containing protein n=1 Tax=Enterobius vermicularis TaxID=51028 RepID=A0A158Q9C1_ENTVE|nr:unnamed protein product [Enterobius vermicularis]
MLETENKWRRPCFLDEREAKRNLGVQPAPELAVVQKFAKDREGKDNFRWRLRTNSMETPTKKTIDALNLASVQRIDPCAVSVIDRVRFAEKEIFGIWICDTTDCERIYKLLQNLVAECAKSPPQIKPSSESPNLLDLLSHSPEGQDNERNHASTKAARKCGDDMPAMLHKLLCDERQLPRGNLPKGAVCADQIEKQLLYDQATKQKSVDFVKKLNTDPSIVSNFSTMSLGALSTTATRGSEAPFTGVPEEEFSSTAAGCSSTVEGLKGIDPPERDVTETEKGSTSQAKGNSAVGLDKEQLVQALEHLLRTDDEFVARLHLAYVDSLNLRLGI